MDLDATQVIFGEHDDDDETDEELPPSQKKPMGQLTVIEGKGLMESHFPIFEGDNIIGRQESCKICIPLKSLSKEHACITVASGVHLIYDKTSRNRTKRGKLFLTPEVRYELQNCDELTFADIHCTYTIFDQIPISGIQSKESENLSFDQGKDVGDSKPLSKTGELNCLASDTVDDLDYASDVSSDILQPTQSFENTKCDQMTSTSTDESEVVQSAPFHLAKRINMTVMETPEFLQKPVDGSFVLSESDYDEKLPPETLVFHDDEDGESEIEGDTAAMMGAATQAYCPDSDPEGSDSSIGWEDENDSNDHVDMEAATQDFGLNSVDTTAKKVAPTISYSMDVYSKEDQAVKSSAKDKIPKESKTLPTGKKIQTHLQLTATQSYDMDVQSDSNENTDQQVVCPENRGDTEDRSTLKIIELAKKESQLTSLAEVELDDKGKQLASLAEVELDDQEKQLTLLTEVKLDDQGKQLTLLTEVELDDKGKQFSHLFATSTLACVTSDAEADDDVCSNEDHEEENPYNLPTQVVDETCFSEDDSYIEYAKESPEKSRTTIEMGPTLIVNNTFSVVKASAVKKLEHSTLDYTVHDEKTDVGIAPNDNTLMIENVSPKSRSDSNINTLLIVDRTPEAKSHVSGNSTRAVNILSCTVPENLLPVSDTLPPADTGNTYSTSTVATEKILICDTLPLKDDHNKVVTSPSADKAVICNTLPLTDDYNKDITSPSADKAVICNTLPLKDDYNKDVTSPSADKAVICNTLPLTDDYNKDVNSPSADKAVICNTLPLKDDYNKDVTSPSSDKAVICNTLPLKDDYNKDVTSPSADKAVICNTLPLKDDHNKDVTLADKTLFCSTLLLSDDCNEDGTSGILVEKATISDRLLPTEIQHKHSVASAAKATTSDILPPTDQQHLIGCSVVTLSEGDALKVCGTLLDDNDSEGSTGMKFSERRLSCPDSSNSSQSHSEKKSASQIFLPQITSSAHSIPRNEEDYQEVVPDSQEEGQSSCTIILPSKSPLKSARAVGKCRIVSSLQKKSTPKEKEETAPLGECMEGTDSLSPVIPLENTGLNSEGIVDTIEHRISEEPDTVTFPVQNSTPGSPSLNMDSEDEIFQFSGDVRARKLQGKMLQTNKKANKSENNFTPDRNGSSTSRSGRVCRKPAKLLREDFVGKNSLGSNCQKKTAVTPESKKTQVPSIDKSDLHQSEFLPDLVQNKHHLQMKASDGTLDSVEKMERLCNEGKDAESTRQLNLKVETDQVVKACTTKENKSRARGKKCKQKSVKQIDTDVTKEHELHIVHRMSQEESEHKINTHLPEVSEENNAVNPDDKDMVVIMQQPVVTEMKEDCISRVISRDTQEKPIAEMNRRSTEVSESLTRKTLSNRYLVSADSTEDQKNKEEIEKSEPQTERKKFADTSRQREPKRKGRRSQVTFKLTQDVDFMEDNESQTKERKSPVLSKQEGSNRAEESKPKRRGQKTETESEQPKFLETVVVGEAHIRGRKSSFEIVVKKNLEGLEDSAPCLRGRKSREINRLQNNSENSDGHESPIRGRKSQNINKHQNDLEKSEGNKSPIRGRKSLLSQQQIVSKIVEDSELHMTERNSYTPIIQETDSETREQSTLQERGRKFQTLSLAHKDEKKMKDYKSQVRGHQSPQEQQNETELVEVSEPQTSEISLHILRQQKDTSEIEKCASHAELPSPAKSRLRTNTGESEPKERGRKSPATSKEQNGTDQDKKSDSQKKINRSKTDSVDLNDNDSQTVLSRSKATSEELKDIDSKTRSFKSKKISKELKDTDSQPRLSRSKTVPEELKDTDSQPRSSRSKASEDLKDTDSRTRSSKSKKVSEELKDTDSKTRSSGSKASEVLKDTDSQTRSSGSKTSEDLTDTDSQPKSKTTSKELKDTDSQTRSFRSKTCDELKDIDSQSRSSKLSKAVSEKLQDTDFQTRSSRSKTASVVLEDTDSSSLIHSDVGEKTNVEKRSKVTPYTRVKRHQELSGKQEDSSFSSSAIIMSSAKSESLKYEDDCQQPIPSASRKRLAGRTPSQMQNAKRKRSDVYAVEELQSFTDTELTENSGKKMDLIPSNAGISEWSDDQESAQNQTVSTNADGGIGAVETGKKRVSRKSVSVVEKDFSQNWRKSCSSMIKKDLSPGKGKAKQSRNLNKQNQKCLKSTSSDSDSKIEVMSLQNSKADADDFNDSARKNRSRLVPKALDSKGSIDESCQAQVCNSNSPITDVGRGKRASKDNECMTPVSKRSKVCKQASENDSLVHSTKEQVISPSLRRKTFESKPRIMFTGVTDEAGQKIVKDLGGELAQTVAECTHLVTDKIRRTVKFLCGLAKGVLIVNPQWLESSKSVGTFVDGSRFLVSDPHVEKQYKFSLVTSLHKATHAPMLQGYRVHVTRSVQPEPAQMKEILLCAGAEYIASMPSKMSEKTLIISCAEDKIKCQPAVKAGLPVVSAEFILTGILRQEVDLENFRLFDNDSSMVQKSSSRGRR